MKRSIKLLGAILCICFAFGFTGCDRTSGGLPIGKLPEYESGYFRYAVDTLPDGTQKAYIVGLTELGMKQKELVYPSTIDKYTVYGIGYYYSTGVYPIIAGEVKSENLQKFFMPVFPKEDAICLYERKVVLWDSSYGYETIKSLQDLDSRTNVYGYNIYVKEDEMLLQRNISFLIANVSYMYNYDNDMNDGYYWVDTYDESLITFIPPEPTREGYIFGGWYKEADCINMWDFETDITGKKIYMDRGNNFYINDEHDRKLLNRKYDGIYLYAKWLPNN